MRRLKRDTPSTVNIRRHPLHPMMVVFPIAFLFSALPADVLFLVTDDPFWARAAFWALLGGLVAGIAAGIVGAVDFVTMREVRRHVAAWSHMVAAIMVLAVAGLNVQLRWYDHAAAVWPWGVAVSALLAAMVAVAAWLGGTLTFRHGIGNYSEPEDDEPTV